MSAMDAAGAFFGSIKQQFSSALPSREAQQVAAGAVTQKVSELAQTATQKAHEIGQATPEAYSQAKLWASENPVKAAGLATGVVVGGTMVVAPAAVAGSALTALGFGTVGGKGIVGGSLAASWMTPGTIAGGIYATLESAAVGGYGLPIVASAIQGTGAGLAGLSVGSAAWLVRKEASNKDKDE